jgi:hypothetical protein
LNFESGVPDAETLNHNGEKRLILILSNYFALHSSTMLKTKEKLSQEDLEENLIKRAHTIQKSSMTIFKRKISAKPIDFKSQQAAQMYCLSDPLTLPISLDDEVTKPIGNLCKVFWDGENQWYYARILSYDPTSARYFVSIYFSLEV